MLTTDDFDYPLPESLIAQQPVEPRDASRLLVLHRQDGAREHRIFRELPDLLRPGDLMVLNDTRVVPARFETRRETGGRIEGLYLRTCEDGTWEVMLRGAGKCGIGEDLRLVGTEASLRLVSREGAGHWRVRPTPPAEASELLEQVGRTPLPPYIRRSGEDPDAPDRRRYQTIYADRPGAVAAPTAGLHFTPEVMDRLAVRGVEQARVTLHVGPGTFAPVKVEDLADHEMHAEWYELSAPAAEAINTALDAGRRVVAVGTTSVRVLETAAGAGLPLEPGAGWTRCFLYPPAPFRVVGGLVTNFHLPRSTLLMLVASFCSPGGADGVETVLAAYRDAVDRQYRFYSYGDAMLIV